MRGSGISVAFNPHKAYHLATAMHIKGCEIMALSGRSTQFRLLFILGSVVIVLFAFFPLHSSIGRAAALAPLVVPMLVVAWFYGLRGAVIASLVSLPVSILMGNLADQTWNISISFMWITATIFRVT